MSSPYTDTDRKTNGATTSLNHQGTLSRKPQKLSNQGEKPFTRRSRIGSWLRARFKSPSNPDGGEFDPERPISWGSNVNRARSLSEEISPTNGSSTMMSGGRDGGESLKDSVWKQHGEITRDAEGKYFWEWEGDTKTGPYRMETELRQGEGTLPELRATRMDTEPDPSTQQNDTLHAPSLERAIVWYNEEQKEYWVENTRAVGGDQSRYMRLHFDRGHRVRAPTEKGGASSTSPGPAGLSGAPDSAPSARPGTPAPSTNATGLAGTRPTQPSSATDTVASQTTSGGGIKPSGAGNDTAATGAQNDDTERIPPGYLASHDGRVYDPFAGYEYEPIREGNSVVWRRTQYRVQGGWRKTKRQEIFEQLPACDYVQPQTSVPGTQAPVQPLAEDTTIRSRQGDGGTGAARRDAAESQPQGGFHQQEEDASSELGDDTDSEGPAPEDPRPQSWTAPPPQDEFQPPDERKPSKPGGNYTNPERQGTGDQSSQDGTGQPDGTAPAGSSAPTRTAPRKSKPKRRAQSANTSPLLKVYNSLRNTAGAVTSTFVSAVPPLIRGGTQLANSIWDTE